MKFTSGQATLALLLPAALSVDITSDRRPKDVCVRFTIFQLVPPPLALGFGVLTTGEVFRPHPGP